MSREKTYKLDPRPPVTEREFQAQAMQLLRLHGWLAFHCWQSINSPKGFPDICAVKGRRTLFLELKSQRGAATPEQEQWLSALRGAGQEAHLLRPSQWRELVSLVTGEGPS